MDGIDSPYHFAESHHLFLYSAFGRAAHYLVVTVEDGKIIERQLRDKLGHAHFADMSHVEQPGQPHGMDAVSHRSRKRITPHFSNRNQVGAVLIGRGRMV
jgi:hypothetical protein